LKKKKIKNIAIFCDLDPSSGFGHFSRMKNLSSELEKKGSICYFIFKSKYKYFIKNYTKNLKVIYYSNFVNEKTEKIELFLIKNKFRIIILDSYRIKNIFEKRLVQKGFFTVSIDDHLKKRYSNIVVNNKVDALDFVSAKKKQLWLTGNKYILINKIQNKKVYKINKFSCFKIFLHAGGSSSYQLIDSFVNSTFAAVQKYKAKLFVLCTNAFSKNFIKKIAKKYKLSNNIKIISYKNNLSKTFFNYDIVAGPAGTSTFEVIQSGVLPFSVSLKNDGKDSLKSWSSLGHLMHLSFKKKKNKKLLENSWSFVFKNYFKLLKMINVNSKSLDGKGPLRVAREILKENKNYNLNTKQKQNLKPFSTICNLSDIREFHKARNQKNVRLLSSNPNHIITWPEHLKWWFRDEIKKYKIIQSNKVVAYYWIKLNFDKQGKFITSGWFMPQGIFNNMRISNEALKFQYISVKSNYKGFVWIITMNKKNLFQNGARLPLGLFGRPWV